MDILFTERDFIKNVQTGHKNRLNSIKLIEYVQFGNYN